MIKTLANRLGNRGTSEQTNPRPKERRQKYRSQKLSRIGLAKKPKKAKPVSCCRSSTAPTISFCTDLASSPLALVYALACPVTLTYSCYWICEESTSSVIKIAQYTIRGTKACWQGPTSKALQWFWDLSACHRHEQLILVNMDHFMKEAGRSVAIYCV